MQYIDKGKNYKMRLLNNYIKKHIPSREVITYKRYWTKQNLYNSFIEFHIITIDKKTNRTHQYKDLINL